MTAGWRHWQVGCIAAAAVLILYLASHADPPNATFFRGIFPGLGLAATASGIVGSRQARARIGWRLVADAGLVLGAIVIVLAALGYYMAAMGWYLVAIGLNWA